MDEIYVAQRPSIKMDEGESTRLLGSSIVLGKDSYSKEKQLNNWKAKWQLFEWRTILSVSYWEWMENQLNSSGKFSQDSQHCRFFTAIQSDLWRDPNIEPEEFSDRIIFMTMFNDMDINRKGNKDFCPLT